MYVSNGINFFHKRRILISTQVFYQVGFTGLIYSIDVVTADATQLKNRALAYAFTSSPYMISAFAGSYASEKMLYDIGWEWGFGTFAILTPFVCFPLYLLLKLNLRKAKREVLKVTSGRTFGESIRHYVIEFDGMYNNILWTGPY